MVDSKEKNGFGVYYNLSKQVSKELPIKYITKEELDSDKYTGVKIGDGVKDYLKQLYSN